MKALCVIALLSVPFAWSQTAPLPAEWKDDTVIATFDDGINLTAGDYKGLIQLHPSWQGKPWKDVVHGYAVIRRAAKEAQDKKLNEKSPYKEALDFDIMYNMADFMVREATSAITVEPGDLEKYYNQHKEMYRQVTVSAIKIAIGGNAAAAPSNASKPVKKALTEEEAKAKAEKLVEQIRAGADFKKLVLLESDDEANKTKGGELGTWKMSDDVPPLMREKVLALHQGEVSDPVQQGPAFYIFHADEFSYTPQKDVEDSIFAAVKQEKTQQWMKAFDQGTQVTFPKKDPEPAPPSDAKK